jgi:RND family efflux transporter MFP subunit
MTDTSKNYFKSIVAITITVVLFAIALFMLAQMWQLYMLSPWTRDGTVRVEVTNIAPEVSGTVRNIFVKDNQYVQRGEKLFEIDPVRFQLAIDQAQAAVESAKNTLILRQADAKRRFGATGAVSAEEQQQYQINALVAKAQLDSAVASLAVAKLNFDRSTLYAPSDGFVTNFLLRVGDYANEGNPVMSIVDKHTFWIDAYFEETKIHAIKVGDKTRIKLMGYDNVLNGYVHSISRGISVENAKQGTQGLQQVNPTYTWVRLAQRIPVRIAFDQVPDDVLLASGLTASVEVLSDTLKQSSFQKIVRHWLEAWL